MWGGGGPQGPAAASLGPLGAQGPGGAGFWFGGGRRVRSLVDARVKARAPAGAHFPLQLVVLFVWGSLPELNVFPFWREVLLK